MGWLDIINSSELVSDAELERRKVDLFDYLDNRKKTLPLYKESEKKLPRK